VLTAVDAALMVIDAANGVEPQTRRLLQVCRARNTPILTFVNKMDREVQEPLSLMDEIERELGMTVVPFTWPVGMGKVFGGVMDLRKGQMRVFKPGEDRAGGDDEIIDGLDNPVLEERFGGRYEQAGGEIELVQDAAPPFDEAEFLAGRQTPMFFGSAVNNFGVQLLLDFFVEHAPSPKPRASTLRDVSPQEESFSGFVFKIQANMDPQHRDRVAFFRVCSGRFDAGMKAFHVRTGKESKLANALTFMASDREHVETAYPGDVIGLHNHGTISIGDTFTHGEALSFTGIPNFAPELFRRARLRDPLKLKQLQKGLAQLSEEGATQFFRPLMSNDLILGAVGTLQFDVVAYRLKDEYGVEATFEPISISTARWVRCDNAKKLEEFREKAAQNLAVDAAGELVYIAPSRVNLQLTSERWPDVQFLATREHAHSVGAD
jgi:peptide chain release factor 3